MNNLGGFKNIELIFADELESFDFNRTGISYRKKDNHKIRLLPLHNNTSSLTTSPTTNDGGTIYVHKASIQLRSKRITDKLMAELSTVSERGCILIGTTNNGDNRVFGDKSYPLFGTFIENNGTKCSDLHQHVLSMSCTCIHPALPSLG